MGDDTGVPSSSASYLERMRQEQNYTSLIALFLLFIALVILFVGQNP